MKLLTRSEELLLLTVWRLQEDAYAVPINEQLKELTGIDYAFGALFVSLERMVKKGLLDSYLSESSPERGGKSKRMYKLTKYGMEELISIKKVQAAAWEDIDNLSLDNLS